MSTQIDPLPPVPQHTPPLDSPGKDEVNKKTPFSITWMAWFLALKIKVDTINGILVNLVNLSGTGLVAKITTTTWALRTIVGVTNRTTITNGNGVAGNPIVDIAATYVGQTTITTLGTITVGVWNGTTIGVTYGGTGLNSYTVGDLLYCSAPNVLAARAAGPDTYVLTMSAGLPTWLPSSTGTGQSAIQFQDEGSNLGSSGAVTGINFVGSGVLATIAGTTITVTVGGSSDVGIMTQMPNLPPFL